jgi:hypothetical protein
MIQPFPRTSAPLDRRPAHALRAGSLRAAACWLTILLAAPSCSEAADARGLSDAERSSLEESAGENVGATTGDSLAHLQEHGVPTTEASPEVQALIDDLIDALTPLPLDLTSNLLDAHFIRGQKTVEKLRLADKEVGIAALHTYASYEGDISLVRGGLLDIAGHAAPEESQLLLSHLLVHYGHGIDDRTQAALVLSRTSPEVYLEIARPYVERKGRPLKTMPPDEFLVKGWVTACEELGISPVPEMVDVVTNLMMEPMARHLAAETLGRYEDPLGQKALENVMIESTGNGYLRRKAAQALRNSIPRETACTLFKSVLEREADSNFALFLQDMIYKNCQ